MTELAVYSREEAGRQEQHVLALGSVKKEENSVKLVGESSSKPEKENTIPLDESLDEASLRPLIRRIIASHDVTTFTHRMLFTEIASSVGYTVENIVEDQAVKARIKTIARELATSSDVVEEPLIKQEGASGVKRSKKRKRSEVSNSARKKPSPKAIRQKGRAHRKSDDHTGGATDDEGSTEERHHKAKKARERRDTRNVNKVEKEPPNAKIVKLRKFVTDLGFGPTTYKGLPKEPKEYHDVLEQRIMEKCLALGVIPEKERRLPTPTEVAVYKKKRNLSKELEGLEMDNILNRSSERPRRRAATNKNVVAQSSDEEDRDDSNDDESENAFSNGDDI